MKPLASTASMAPAEPASNAPGLLRPCWTMVEREMMRFIRQRSRIIGALGTPLVFWFIVGGGLGRSFSLGENAPAVRYMEYTFPGALATILLFTSIFSMISIIDDRREGFMQGVLVAPVSRWAVVFGKIGGASILAVAQATLFLLLAPLADIHLSVMSVVAAVASMMLVAVAVTGLGFWLAWLMDSTQGFHAIMNLVLMPMLVLSGAFFPPGGSATLLRWLTYLNPMTYAVALIRHALYANADGNMPHLFSLSLSLAVTAGFAFAMLTISVVVATRETARALH